MAFADSLNAGATTATFESKTNYFAPAPLGGGVTDACVPLHRGRRSMTWQTRRTNPAGRLLAQVIQTQTVLELRP